jgi:hypothetical protein
MSRLFTVLMLAALAAAPALAQNDGQAQGQAKASTNKSADQKREETAVPARAQRDEAAGQQARAQNEGQAVNTRIELTITDARGEGTPITKIVSVITADRSWGRIRTQGEARTPNGQRFPVILNVDARPTLVNAAGGYNRARVELTIEYRPADEIGIVGAATISSPRRDPDSITPNINESLALILEDGKPIVISQSADPVTDRKVKVEAKLTILR